ncbi:MAG: polysaccharide biosynthesis C-terminal domain-containing protein [Cohaesibacter sp.]|nr:polysaccharide biosynthesis C-terminal domain-containing protein [Cohaesibacter sp.]
MNGPKDNQHHPISMTSHKAKKNAPPNRDKAQNKAQDKAMKQQAMLAFAIRLAGAGLLYLVQILLARLLGQKEYGLYALVWVWVIMLSQCACMGFNTAILRFLPGYSIKAQTETARTFVITARDTALGFASLFAILGLSGTYLFSNWLDQTQLWPIYLGMACLPLFALGEIYEGAALARSRILTALLPSFILRPLLVALGLIIASISGLPTTATTAMQAALLATALATIIQVIGANKALKAEWGPETKIKKARPEQARHWFKTAGPLVLLDGFYLITINADIILLGLLLGPEPIAIYYASVKTLALVAYIHFATSLVAARPFADLFATQTDIAQINALYRKMTHWTLWPSLATAALIIIAAPYILALFGPDYDQGLPVIAILSVGLVIQGAAGPVQNLLNMAGEEKSSAKSAFIAMAVNISFNLLLIPIWGIYGAALATTIGTTTQAMMMLTQAHKKLGLRPAFLPQTKPHLTQRQKTYQAH